LKPRQLPSNVCPAGFVPHTWLMPKGSCVVHHGGSGTTASACVSGVPSVFVPHGSVFDQFYLGILAEELGIAGKAIPQTELTAPWLAKALRNLLDNPSYSETARRLGAKIRAEQGVQKARELIEEFASRLGIAGPRDVAETRQRGAGDRRERLEMRRARQRVRRRA
ncbi:MAG: nucleotide disphospho-sugar-binding domain-containing protein, partial [Acidobacteriota bacterium]